MIIQPSERRAKAKAELRGRILEAARALFVKRGYEAVTMREIARQVGYTPTALYYHFPDKESLLRALCENDFSALSEQFNRLGRIADPIERLRRIGEAYAKFGLEYPQHYRLMFLTAHPEPVSKHIEKGNPEQDAYAFLLQAVREGVAAGRFRQQLTDPELIAQVLWGNMHGQVSLRLQLGDNPRVDWRPAAKAVQMVVGPCLDGLLR